MDDVRDTRALLIATELIDRGSVVVGYDKLAEEAFRGLLGGIEFASSASKAISGADGCIIQTEDPDFALLSKRDFSSMRTKVVIDGRGLLDGKKLKSWGVKVRTIGLGEIL